MVVLSMRTDKPEAEIGLFNNGKKLAYETWQAHRQLSETIHKRIEHILKSQSKNLDNIEGIVVFKGPGSFTGLRIGISVANALALGLQKPIVGTTGENWISDGTSTLEHGNDESAVTPEYGRDPHITKPRK